MRYARFVPIVAVALALASVPARVDAQSGPTPDSGNLVRTRADLEQLLAQKEAALSSSGYSDSEKRVIRAEADQIRNRLQYGDFRVGDRILLQVEGEPNIPDTVTVEPGQNIDLPLFGEISVAGVLRSEISAHLQDALAVFIRDPVVRADGLMRVSVTGAVGRPGFYTMPAQTVIGDAIMVAGGPSGNANLEKVQIYRGTVRIMEDDGVREALQQGLTLDQLNLQAGDQIEVPERESFWNFRNILSAVGVITSLTFLIIRISGN